MSEAATAGRIHVIVSTHTDLLALRTAVEGLPKGFRRVSAATTWAADPVGDLQGASCVLVRLLGGRRAWAEGFDRLRAKCAGLGVALLAFSGEATPDPELTAASTVPSATVTEAFAYLAHGGPANLAQLLRFVADTVCFDGWGFEPPSPVADHGVWRELDPAASGPVVGIVFYRAHLVAGNTQFVDDLCAAVSAAGGRPLAVWCYSLREKAAEPVAELLHRHNARVLVTTVLAAGGAAAAAGTTGGPGGAEGEGWDVSELAQLDIPVVQAPSAGRSSDEWAASDSGLGPFDVASGIAIPELDGRIIAPTFAFSEVVDDGDQLGTSVRAYRSIPDRASRVARLALRLARLRDAPPWRRRVAIVLSAYPTKRSRLGNAVGLDTPASALVVLDALAGAGYRIEGRPPDGDALMGALADGLTYDAGDPTQEQLTMAVGSLPVSHYAAWLSTLPDAARDDLESAWGPPPGRHRVHDEHLVFSGIELGNVIIAIQPPRGYGDDPIAVYHSPSLPPTHHYLAFYRWLDEVWGADAVVHLGKHGTLEWLPGKSVALSAGCWPDAALGDVPLFYPFVVNDPGEGTQAKRRSHAVVVDHLVPPMTRADTYDELERLEQLFDEYAQLQSLDPAKLPALREQIWALLRDASIDQDLGLSAVALHDRFDDVVLAVDGYLCSLKDAQIRGGLHVLGLAPAGDALVDMALAITRLPQGSVPSLRHQVASDLGLDPDDPQQLDRIEETSRSLVLAAASDGWVARPDATATIAWVCTSLVPNLRRAGDEVTNLLAGLDGRYVPAGPSGAPTRGCAHVLPTGRNFYSVDPKALPTELAWEVGKKLADAVLDRHLEEEGCFPETVGLVLWGTAAMRTQGDDVAEALALLGVRPVWEERSRRVVGLEPIPLAELGRPRVDVTLRISGFFRDAFPSMVALLDEAVALVAGLDERPEENLVRAHGAEDPRIFGPAPSSYGVGILSLIEGRNWRSDDDLAAVYVTWSGWSYTRRGFGLPAVEAMQRRFAAIDVAVKNQDNREHDIFDSDDYLQEHGGMVATIRSLTGRDPKAWFGDSANPARPLVRSLAEEAARVVRTRVINPKWMAAMRRHGYKGAFEMAATVDYLFGYDVTAHVAQPWMYERVAQAYVANPENRALFEQSNPWALRSIVERLLEAEERGRWKPDGETADLLRRALLDADGWEESR